MFSAVKRWKTKDKRDSRGISDGGPSSTRPLSSGEAPKNQLGPPKASPSSVNQQIQRAPLAIDTNKRADRLLESGIGYDDSKKPTKGFLSMCQDGDRADAIAYATQHASEFAASLHIPIDPNGNTALHLAVAYNDFLLVALLLQRGANPNAFNRSNVTPTMLAKRMSYSKLVRVLKRYGGTLPTTDEKFRHSTVQGGGGRRPRSEANNAPMGDSARRTSMNVCGASENVVIVAGNAPLCRASFATDGIPRAIPESSREGDDSGKTGGVNDLDQSSSPIGTDSPGMTKPFNMSVHDACFLGLYDALKPVLKADVANTMDQGGFTPLMKAAYNGHVELVRRLIDLGVEVDARDRRGITALIWASLMGREDVVRVLVEAGHSDVNGARNQPAVSQNAKTISLTPLVAAVFRGSEELTWYLIDKGADVNLKAGTGRSALMLAAWVKKPALVKLLVSRGAICDSEAAERIKNGILFFNRLRMEWNVWLSKSSATKDISLVQTGGSLKAMLLYLTTEDTELIGTILGILQSKSQEEVEQVAESGNKEAHTVTFKVAEVSDAVQDDAAAAKARRRTSKRASSYRQGINFEKLIGNNPDILELTDQIPSSGTELDEICVSVFECVVQLMLAANKNVKHQYVTIAAKAVHHTTDLLRAIEVLEKSAGKPLTIAATPASALSTTSTLMPPASAALIASAGITQSPSWSRVRADNDITFISSSPVRERISEVARVLNLEHSRQLMVTTRISVGVWPPANAISDMIKAAATLAKACRSLAQLANSTGFFPILGHKLEMRFELFDQFGEPAQESGKLDGGDRRVNKASFTNFKRQHQLKLIEEASKSYAQGSSSDGPSAALSNDSLEAEEASTEFSNALDNLVRQFVASVSELKRVQMMHLTEEYVFVTSTVNARADAIIQEVRSYEPFSDIPDTITLEPADARLLTKAGVRLSPELILPAPINLPLSSATTELEAAADLVMFRGKVASGPWPPPSSSSEMLQSTIPCVMAVKMLMNLAKMAAVKIKTTASEERVKREQWKKDCLQNEKVKKLFQIWEDQFRTVGERHCAWITLTFDAQDSDVTMTDGSLTEEDAAILEESTEGLVLEESHATNKKVVKGGRLQQLIERATSPSNDDAEYLPILISTHHSFTTSLELLTMLIKRYSVTPQYGLNQRQFDLVLNKKVVPIRLGVCHFLKLWISNHFEEDFAQNEALVLRFRDFVQRKVAHDFEAFSVELLQTLDNKLEGIEAASVVQTPARSPLPTNTSFLSVPSTPPPSSSPLIASLTFQKRAQTTDLASLLNSDPAYFFEIDPYEMARQLTAMEFTYFTGVKPYECTDQIWGERRQKELKWAPTGKETGIARMIRHTNQLTNWVASNIVSCETLKARVSALKYFMQLALGCREVNNFNGITGVVAGLSMAPVTRLKKTWQALSEKFQKIHDAYTEVADTVSPKAQYANYRRALKDLKPPLIPFLGVYLTDLTFIELGNPSFLPDTLFINFEKRRKVYATIKQIRMHQQTAYSISAVAAIQDFLRSVDGVNASQKEVLLTEDELYEQSLIVEPREDESESDSHDDD